MQLLLGFVIGLIIGAIAMLFILGLCRAANDQPL